VANGTASLSRVLTAVTDKLAAAATEDGIKSLKDELATIKSDISLIKEHVERATSPAIKSKYQITDEQFEVPSADRIIF
jgi:hypothetical protein